MDYGRAIIVDDLASVELGPSRPVIYDREIDLRLPYEDPASGAEHYLIRYPAGLTTRAHRHTAAHTILVLEGWLESQRQGHRPGRVLSFPGRGGDEARTGPGPMPACSSSCSTGRWTCSPSTNDDFRRPLEG